MGFPSILGCDRYGSLPPRRNNSVSDVKDLFLDVSKEVVSCSKPLPKGSPYVGFQRHAPPSPVLRFLSLDLPDDVLSSAQPRPQLGIDATGLCEVLWSRVLAFVAEVKSIARIALVAPCFHQAMLSPMVWANLRIRIAPQAIDLLAPRLGMWLQTWRFAQTLVLPNSEQLIAEVQCLSQVPIEVAWRFDAAVKAAGIEVLKRGAVVKRKADDELVVIGDYPVLYSRGPNCTAPYMEVRIDSRLTAPVQLNDMGIGFTASNPRMLQEICAVADEIPCSWVVDFTQSSVVLSVNNREAARGYNLSSFDLHEGDRLGLRLRLDGIIEVYINGALRQTISPNPEDRIPEDILLYPVFDLYGLTAQISCTGAEEPLASAG